MPRLSALTLVSALLLAFTVTSNIPGTHALVGGQNGRMIRRYKHVHLQNRQILDDILGETDEETSTPVGPAGPGVTPTGSVTVTRGPGGILGGIGSVIGGGSQTVSQTTTTTEEVTPTSTSTSTRTVAPTRTSTSTQSSVTTPPPQPTTTRIVYEDATPEQKAEIEENRAHQSTLTRIPENVRVILIVVASILAGLIIVWTAVRKWKLRSSRSFQSRLAPIEWQPDADKAHPGAHGGLTAPAMSEASDKDSIRRNMFAPDGPPASLAPPAHDFTAGAGGYARSASPMPNPYARTPSPAPYRTASPAPYRTTSPAPYRTASPAPIDYSQNPHRGY